MRLRRDLVRVVDMRDEAAQQHSPASPEECFKFVWDLTKEAYSLSGKFDVESRLQRDVVRVIRGGKDLPEAETLENRPRLTKKT